MGREHGGNQAKGHACDSGKQKRKTQDKIVDANGVHLRQTRRQERAQGFNAPVSESYSCSSAKQTEHRSFTEQLADDSSAPGAQRSPNCNLFRTGGRAGKK